MKSATLEIWASHLETAPALPGSPRVAFFRRIPPPSPAALHANRNGPRRAFAPFPPITPEP